MTNKIKRVVIGMSGGVDSSVGAYLLKEQGYDVLGVFMRNWEEEDENGVCTATQDYEDAVAVCVKLGIPYMSVNFSKEYYERVFQRFLNAYQQGLTPNPDVLCNREIKFRAFLEYAREDLQADYLATGHYARIKHTPHGTMLLRGVDASKDQAYFLSMLSAPQLDRVLFPVGAMQKRDVRRLAEHLGLRTSKKKDSTGICFIGERNFARFLHGYLGSQPGDILDYDTKHLLGHHDGLMYYTLGQRRGLGIGGVKGGEGRWYVAEKDMQNNILYVVNDPSHPALWSRGLCVRDVNLISPDPSWSLTHFPCQIKFRHLQKDIDAVLCLDESLRFGQVHFNTKQKGVSPGQICAFYQGEVCFGAGVITNALK